MPRLALLAAILAVPAVPAAAHDLWLSPGPGGVLVQYGHPHEPEMPAAGKLTALIAYGPTGATPLAVAPVSEPVPALRAALEGDALVAASYDNGYWVRLPDGSYRNASRRTVPDGEKSQWSAKYAKAAIGPSAAWGTVVGQPLEIVPLEDPSTARGAIRVRVLFEGRPLAGADVSATDGATFKAHADQVHAATDAAGVAVVPLRAAGPQVLEVNRRVSPSQTPQLAEFDSYGATFAFTVTDPKTN